jgi:RNA polymerase sigma-70 factor (ECF subfamily)
VRDLEAKRSAVAALFETRYQRVVRYLALRIGNVQEAEDLASEVFVRALRSVDTYKESRAPLEVWVFTKIGRAHV